MAGNLILTLTGIEVDGTSGIPHPILQAAEISTGRHGNSSHASLTFEVKAIAFIFTSILTAWIRPTLYSKYLCIKKIIDFRKKK